MFQVASWAGEGTTRSVTDTAYLNSVAPTGGEMWCTIQASNWFVEDATFNVAEYVISEAARQFASAEAEAFATGNGTNKPTGLTNGATEATADQGASPERDFGTFEHIASGVAADLPGDRLSSPLGDVLSPFVDCVSALRAGYLPNAAWYMNPSVKGALIKKRDVDGRPLIESGLMGDPDRLLGYPIRIAEHLPAIGANTLPIWFGDMAASYLVADRVGLKVIVDDVTTKGHTLWYVSRRVYGAPLDTAGLKCIKIATS
jgi:HK97 family phage major capsid protein